MIPRYSLPEMSNVFTDVERFRRWLEIELLATEAFGGFHIDGTEGEFADVGLGLFGAGGSAR